MPTFYEDRPADNQAIAAGPKDIRDNLIALRDNKIVNAQKLMDLSPGNASGNIPVNNGNLNVNLNAEKLGGNYASAFAASGHTHNTATSSSNGMMSNTDKAKLDTINANAQVNQNAFSNVQVGSTTIQADGVTDTLELIAGTGVTLAADATNDRVTITGHSNTNDPTIDQKAALTGTNGSPSSTNKYVTSSDPRLSDARTPIAHTHAGSDVTSTVANATAATKLQTARTINGVAFDGTTNITVTAYPTPHTHTAADLPVASTATNGTVKIGAGLLVNASGLISVSGDSINNNTGVYAANKQADRWIAASESSGVVDYTTSTGDFSRFRLHTQDGVTAGTYSLQNIIQELVNRSHYHKLERCDYNCDCCNDCCGDSE